MNDNNNQNFKQNYQQNYDNMSNSLSPLSKILKSVDGYVQQFLEWFKELPQWGKITGLIVIPIFIIKILEAVVSIVSLLISLVVFGGVIYLGYRFFVEPNYLVQDKKDDIE
ncbi:MAG: hypothetical protein AB4080_07150 [Trichodesmium sp.]